jgi:alpha-ketoglutarate-dependent taurine dioxygenase
LCGTEFDSIEAELRFFERHSLPVDGVQVEVPLSQGEMLVFDNLAVAHGRRGTRRPAEVHQWVFGEALGVARQRELRSRLLACFQTPASGDRTGAD